MNFGKPFGKGATLEPRVKEFLKQDCSYLHCLILLHFQNSAVQTLLRFTVL